jgi:hypothetical protein
VVIDTELEMDTAMDVKIFLDKGTVMYMDVDMNIEPNNLNGQDKNKLRE